MVDRSMFRSLSVMELSMRRSLVFFILLPSLLAGGRPALALQGNISVGGRVGTLGMGAEITVAVSERVAIRGGAGFLGFEVDVTERSNLASNRTAELSLPSALLDIGAEFSSGILKAGAGLLIRSGDPAYEITYGSGASIDIGGSYYTEPDVSTLTTTLVSGSIAPYALLGFAPDLSPGLTLVVDLGAALPLDAGFEMSATGDPAVLSSSGFRADLEAERREAEDDAGGWLNYWPIVSVGLRYQLR